MVRSRRRSRTGSASGKTLFDSNGQTLMPLREARTVGDGIAILAYRPID